MSVDKYKEKVDEIYEEYHDKLLEIVEALGYRAVYFIANQDNADLAGAIYYKKKTIFVSPMFFQARGNLTLAHALAHIILGHDKYKDKEYIEGAEIVAWYNRHMRG